MNIFYCIIFIINVKRLVMYSIKVFFVCSIVGYKFFMNGFYKFYYYGIVGFFFLVVNFIDNKGLVFKI